MKLLIGGKNRNIYKRKDGSAYYKSGGQQVDVTYMFKKKGGGLKKKYIKGGMTEKEFKSLQEKCIELNGKLKKLQKDLKDYRFNSETSNEFISNINSVYYTYKPLNQLANQIYEDITKVDFIRATDKYQPLIKDLPTFINLLTDKNDGPQNQKIKKYLDVMDKAIDIEQFGTAQKEVLGKLSLIIEALAPIIRKDFKIDVVEEEVEQQNKDPTINLKLDENDPDEDEDGIKGIKFDSIKIDSRETDKKKKTLKQICCLALYGLAAGMTDGLNVETRENKDKIKVLNKIKDKKQFINHLKQSYGKLSINETSTPDQINREIKQFGFVNYNDSDGVFVTRAYILNKILQCFEGKDYIASSNAYVKRKEQELLLNGKTKLIDPKTGIMKSIDITDLLQLFTNIHTIVELTNGAEAKIDISFSNLYYVLFFEEDIGSSQTVTEEANHDQGKTEFDETVEQLVEENIKRKQLREKILANPESPSSANSELDNIPGRNRAA